MRKAKNISTEEQGIVTGVEHQGKGVMKQERGVLFADKGLPGERVTVSVTHKKKGVYFGYVTEVLEANEQRVTPFCRHFGVCGGCSWQHADYPLQLAMKAGFVRDAFNHIGRLTFPEPLPILGCKETTYYRNKLEFAFSHQRWLYADEIQWQEKLEKEGLGFHYPGKFDKIVDIEHCYLQGGLSNEIRLFVKKTALEQGLTFFDHRKKTGMLRTMHVRNTSLGEWMVLLCFSEYEEEKAKKLLEAIRKQFSGITSLLYLINNTPNDTIYAHEVKVYAGRDFIIEQLGTVRYKITVKSFFQTNSAQAFALYNVTREFAGLTGQEYVMDLYSGTGSIALFLSDKCTKVIGIESIPEAVEDAKENAILNGIEKVKFYCGEVEKIIGRITEEEGTPDVIITDPPRAGMHPDVIDTLLQIKAHKIVYVSCNPVTQARDIQMLSASYSIEKIQPVDMFPHTYHIENIALLQLKIQEA